MTSNSQHRFPLFSRIKSFILFLFLILAQNLSLPVEAAHLDQVISNKSGQDADKTYGVIVDCGSSGTRAFIFNWNSSLDYPELLKHVEPVQGPDGSALAQKVHPGLSSLEDNPSKAPDYMRPIVDFILRTIPKESLEATSVYIIGTAGMRLLEKETAANIMNSISQDWREKYGFAKVQTSVISGSTEGMYQWITVNSGTWLEEGDAGRTLGVMEMGGSSLQLTYHLSPEFYASIKRQLASKWPDALEAFESQIVEPQISREAKGRPYKLLSATFLGLGSVSVREAYVDLLIRSRLNELAWTSMVFKDEESFYNRGAEWLHDGRLSERVELEDPCLPRGAEESVEKPTRMIRTRTQTLGFSVDGEEKAFNVTLTGSGDHHKCSHSLINLLQHAIVERMNCKRDEPCTLALLGTPFVPFDMVEFVGLSDFYYTTNEILDLAGNYDSREMEKRTKKICAMSYAELLTHFPDANEVDVTRCKLECFKAVWLETFLSFGIGMPATYDKFTTVEKMGNNDVEWTLGAVLDNSQSIEATAESSSRTD